MKILLINTQTTGHQETYVNGLLAARRTDDTVLVIAPPGEFHPKVQEKEYQRVVFSQKKYFLWLGKMRYTVKHFRPDVVHFVYGDDLYRYFGLGLRWIAGRAMTVITCHQIRRSRLRDISLKRIARCSSVVVVHTKQLKEDLELMGIRNVRHVEYPRFITEDPGKKPEALKKLGIDVSEEIPILLALGGTREDKGLDILLQALKSVSEPFHLIVAGKEEYFKRDYIQEQTETYRDKVTMRLEFLSNETMSDCLSAADMIVLPYRKQFDGASGPLGEGVWYEKQIIGPDHGSLGRIITENHLGKTFRSEDAASLSNVLSEALKEGNFVPDETYAAYRNQLDPAFFAAQYSELYHMEGTK